MFFEKDSCLPLRFTSLKRLAKTSFPLKAFLNPKKLSLLVKVSPYTLLGYIMLENVYDLAHDVENRKLEGNYVECGVWKGGCAAIMGYITNKYKSGRTTWYFDSFEGMPEPTEKDARGRGKKGKLKI